MICLQIDSVSLGQEEYLINKQQENLYIHGGSEVALLYGVYTYAEHLGVRFALHGDILPDEKFNKSLFDCPEIKGKPLFEKRGLGIVRRRSAPPSPIISDRPITTRIAFFRRRGLILISRMLIF